MNRIEEEDEDELQFWHFVFTELLLLKLPHRADEDAGDSD